MSDKILVPSFSTDGYSLSDAMNKNKNGLCAFEGCKNNADSEHFCMGLRVCKKCHKPIQDGIAKDRAEEEAEFWKRLLECFSDSDSNKENDKHK